MKTFLIRWISRTEEILGEHIGTFETENDAMLYGYSNEPIGTESMQVLQTTDGAGNKIMSMLEEIEAYMYTVTSFLDETSAVDFTTFLSYICLILELRCEAEELDVIEIAEKLYLNIKKMNERDRRSDSQGND